MFYRRSLFLFLFTLPAVLWGQNRYWVAFTDKANSTFSVSNPAAFLSEESLNRRKKNGVTLSEEDLPVNASYIQNIKNRGAEILYSLKWFNGAVIECEAAVAQNLTSESCVKSVELVARGKADGGRRGGGSGGSGGSSGEKNNSERGMIGLDTMNNSGLSGQGINVAIFDDGFSQVNSLPAFAPLFSQNRVKQTANLVNVRSADNSVYNYGDHGVNVLSLMASTSRELAGSLPKANYFLFRTEEQKTEFRIEEYNWARAMEMADSAGVHLINSSLGYSTFDDSSMNYTPAQLDGNTAVITRAAAKGVSKGIVVVVSAGNTEYGWEKILFPADARGVIAVGAVDDRRVWSSSSTTGPTADGRVKPEVMAPGVKVPVLTPSGEVTYKTGTSFAGPLVACLAGGIMEARPHLTAVQVAESIIFSADRYESPNSKYGYGLPHFLAAKSYIEKNSGKSFENFWACYPNPAGKKLFITSHFPPAPASLVIWDTTGRPVFQTQVNFTWADHTIEIDISLLSQGLYYLKINSPTGDFIKRIMKE